LLKEDEKGRFHLPQRVVRKGKRTQSQKQEKRRETASQPPAEREKGGSMLHFEQEEKNLPNRWRKRISSRGGNTVLARGGRREGKGVILSLCRAHKIKRKGQYLNAKEDIFSPA